MQWSLQRLEILSVCSGMAISLLLPRAEEKKEKYRKKNKIRYLYTMAEKSKGTTEESRKKKRMFQEIYRSTPTRTAGPLHIYRYTQKTQQSEPILVFHDFCSPLSVLLSNHLLKELE